MWPKIVLSPQMEVSLECKVINISLYFEFLF